MDEMDATKLEDPHPWYGPCDAFLPGERCSKCHPDELAKLVADREARAKWVLIDALMAHSDLAAIMCWMSQNTATVEALMSGEPTDDMIRAAANAYVYPSVYMGGPPEMAKRTAKRILEAALKAATLPSPSRGRKE